MGKEQVQSVLRKILDIRASSSAPRANSLPPRTCNDVVIEDIEFESEPGIRVPGWFLRPSSGGSSLPVILMAEDRGKDGLFEDWALIQNLTRAGFALCSIDLRSNGATTPRFPSEGPLFYGQGVEIAYSLVNLSIGSPIIGQQTYDLLRGVDYLEARGANSPARGTGTSPSSTLYEASCLGGCLPNTRIFLFLIMACAGLGGQTNVAPSYDQPYRPQYHFSPREHWTNDPNGLIYLDGEYHLFFQYNPFGDEWGHMSWGHAVSPDLLHWKQLAVAIPEQSGIMIFTGSTAIDTHNTSGFCKAGKPCLVAV